MTDRDRQDEAAATDKDPGAHVDYYKGGDFPHERLGPEGGFEERADFRRSDRHSDQGQSVPDDNVAAPGLAGGLTPPD